MDRCIVVSASEAKFSALASTAALPESIGLVARLGFDSVELAIRDPALIDRGELIPLLRRHGLPVAAIGTGQAYGEEGLSFADPRAQIREAAVRRVKAQMDLSLELGGALVIIGLIRGRTAPGEDPALARRRFVDCVRECLDHRPGVTLALEPINRYETDLFNDVEGALAAIEEVGRPNLGLLADSFHMNIEEPDIAASLRRAGRRLVHVHFADSNRWAPGQGHIDFPALVLALREIGYRGAVSAEILPKPSSAECMRLSMEAFGRLGLGGGRRGGEP